MSALDAHERNFRALDAGAPDFVRALRQRGFERFAALGLPTTQLEDWKYTNLAPLAGQSFALPGAAPDHAAASAGAARLGAGVELVFVNGAFVPALSRLAALTAGVVAGSLAAALREHPGLVEPHLGRHADFEDDGVTALNTAFVGDGAFLWLPDGAVVEAPIHCLFVSATANGATVTHPRNLIVAGAGSRATVIEHYTGAGRAYWTNAVTEVVLGPGARVAHYRVQRESDAAFHLGTVAVDQAADGQLASHAVSFGAALSRTAIATRLDAPGAGCSLDGLYVAGGAQHVDHHTTIDHRRPRGTSRELYKGILDGRATGVFNGKVFVRPDAQQTDAQQMNKNLLLSDDAQVDTKPQLEILADDVKCSHGATIGQLDDDAIFYLRARGIDAADARQLLVYAFANELLDRITVEPLRARLERELAARRREDRRMSTARKLAPAALDVERLRAHFPILHQQVHGKPLIYLDNAASAQKPRAVIDAVARFDSHDYANIHRGVHALSQRATAAFEAARDRVAAFLHAADRKEIIFTRGTTESINLVAHSFGRAVLQLGDEIVVSTMEHHSNIVPWQMVCRERGAVLRVIPMNDDGELELDAYEHLLGPRTRLVAVVHVSNALGTINPVRQMIELAHARGIPVLLDGAQAVPHLPVDVQALDCDFYAFSSHKLFGPTGVGVLYGKAALLDAMPPYQGGGEMISAVTFEKTFYKGLPGKFEAGTPNITGVVGLGAALDYVNSVGLDAMGAWEHELLAYATAGLRELPQVRLIGTAREKASVLSFVVDGIHPHDIGTILDREGIAVRAGHHCAQPVMQRFRIPATTRASFAFYNTKAEVDALIAGLRTAIEVFA